MSMGRAGGRAERHFLSTARVGASIMQSLRCETTTTMGSSAAASLEAAQARYEPKSRQDATIGREPNSAGTMPYAVYQCLWHTGRPMHPPYGVHCTSTPSPGGP